MKRIILIAKDFDSLETKLDEYGDYALLNDSQFARNEDCPIARACKRMGWEKVSVISDEVSHSKGYICINGTFKEVSRVAHSIANGAKWGAIKVIGQYPKRF